MAFLSEAEVEEILLSKLAMLGYGRMLEAQIGPDGSNPERASYGDTLLMPRLRAAVDRLNPGLPSEAQEDAIRKVIQTEFPALLEENRRLHRLITEGVGVEYYAEDGTLRGDQAHLIDFENPDANDWLAVNQFTVIENSHTRRPDVAAIPSQKRQQNQYIEH